VGNLTKAYLRMVYCEIIQGVWYEAQGHPSYHMLFQKGRGPYSPLGDGVTLDPPDGHANGHTHLLIHLALLDISINLGGHATHFFQGRG
jgi:hypothetical protein